MACAPFVWACGRVRTIRVRCEDGLHRVVHVLAVHAQRKAVGVAGQDVVGEALHRHPGSPAARLLQEQTPLWLETCRILSGRSIYYPSDSSGQTMTRNGRGQPVRYLGKWWEHMKFDNPNKIMELASSERNSLKSS